MSVKRATYLDSSAIVKLVVKEPESTALRHYLRRKHHLITSALARTEVVRAMLPFGQDAVDRCAEVLRRLDIVRINDRILSSAGQLRPIEVRSLDAIHLATAQVLGEDLSRVCTYDERMAAAAESLGMTVVAPD